MVSGPAALYIINPCYMVRGSCIVFRVIHGDREVFPFVLGNIYNVLHGTRYVVENLPLGIIILSSVDYGIGGF